MFQASALPHARESIGEIQTCLGRSAAIFLDFDGTLSPIVAKPEEASVSESTRDVLRNLADRFSIAIVSGRSAADVRRRVGIEGLVYAGSHGQEIDMPDGSRFEYPGSVETVESLNKAEQTLTRALAPVEGVSVERKPFSIAVHFRNARTEASIKLAQSSALVAAVETGLVARDGKKIVELRPDVEWGKGKAIEYLTHRNALNVVPLFIGDDETDEDGFTVTNELGGVSVVVVEPEEDRATVASYRLEDPGDVVRFLARL